MPSKVGGLHRGRAGRLVNSKVIMEVTVGCRLRKKRCRMAADGSGWKRIDLRHQRCEGSRDGRQTSANARSRQEVSRREDKRADTRGRHVEGVGPQQACWTLWRESGASGCTRPKKWKAKKAREIREERMQRADATSGRYSPGSGLGPSGEKGFLLMLIIKPKVYGFIGWLYVRTHAPWVISFLEASERRLRLLDGSTFQDMFN